MIKEESLNNKGVNTFKVDLIRDAALDRDVYEAGVRAETARFDRDSFAEQIFSQLFTVRAGQQ